MRHRKKSIALRSAESPCSQLILLHTTSSLASDAEATAVFPEDCVTYPSHFLPVVVQRSHSGFVSSHFTRRILKLSDGRSSSTRRLGCVYVLASDTPSFDLWSPNSRAPSRRCQGFRAIGAGWRWRFVVRPRIDSDQRQNRHFCSSVHYIRGDESGRHSEYVASGCHFIVQESSLKPKRQYTQGIGYVEGFVVFGRSCVIRVRGLNNVVA